MKTLQLNQMENLNGGECDASDAFNLLLAAGAVATIIVFPPSGFAILPVAGLTGLSTGMAIGSCIW
ncbi:hypothetical protein [uncultured Pontibacter sp.]|uniref:hypothetical protein n=1 Tax=uncultured Pontibacter sp. TaxID=453356 RepID=UPI002616107D|nr:hypothetical protein [uncultured Pontibacter sp.]